jgi:aconitate hydratase A / 2-methylisocitrate dehydratase
MDYLRAAGLVEPLEALGFHLAGFGCMTCIGASGPLVEEVAAAVRDHDLTWCRCCRATATSRAASTPR